MTDIEILGIETVLLALALWYAKPWKNKNMEFAALLASYLFYFVGFVALLSVFGSSAMPGVSSEGVLLLGSFLIVPTLVYAALKYSDPQFRGGFPSFKRDAIGFAAFMLVVLELGTWLPCGKGAGPDCSQDPNKFPDLAYRQFTLAAPFSSWTWDAFFFWALAAAVGIASVILIAGWKRSHPQSTVKDIQRQLKAAGVLVAILVMCALFAYWRSGSEPPMFHVPEPI